MKADYKFQFKTQSNEGMPCKWAITKRGDAFTIYKLLLTRIAEPGDEVLKVFKDLKLVKEVLYIRDTTLFFIVKTILYAKNKAIALENKKPCKHEQGSKYVYIADQKGYWVCRACNKKI